MDHLDEFIRNVGGLGSPIVFRGQGSGPDEDVPHADLASSVALTVVTGEPFHQGSHKVRLPAEEYPVPGDKDVVENGQHLVSSELMVAHVQGGPLQLPGIARLTPVNEEEALRIRRHGKGDGVVLLVLPEGHGGHDDHFLGIDHSGLVGLCPAHHHPILAPLHHAEEQIRVGLLHRPKAPVSLHVGHGPVHHQVLLLDPLQKIFKAPMVGGPVLFVRFKGRAVEGIHGVHAHAALEAGSRLLPQKALHFDFVHQILAALVDGGKAVDGLSREVGGGGHEAFMLALVRELEGHGHGIEGGADDGVVHRVFHPLSQKIYL